MTSITNYVRVILTLKLDISDDDTIQELEEKVKKKDDQIEELKSQLTYKNDIIRDLQFQEFAESTPPPPPTVIIEKDLWDYSKLFTKIEYLEGQLVEKDRVIQQQQALHTIATAAFGPNIRLIAPQTGPSRFSF